MLAPPSPRHNEPIPHRVDDQVDPHAAPVLAEPPAIGFETAETRGGFRVSLGFEGGSKNVFGRIEMRYQDLGDYTVFTIPTGFARTNTQIVAGIGVRF